VIRRTLDGTYLTQVANHQTVRPSIGFLEAGELDFRAFAADPANYVIEADHGGWLLEAKGPGVYEIHSLFLPEGRGKSVFVNARLMLRWMFTRTDAVEIWTRCPDDNPAARMLALKNGFREVFRREAVWNTGTEFECGVSYQSLTIDGWAQRDAEALKAGRAFHDALEAAKKAAGSELPIHPDDEAHDRAAGAAWLMVNEGQTLKGAQFYSRWATFAGYVPIQAVGHQTVDIADGVVEVSGGETRVLLLR
jgi:hypothetical protein